MPTLKHNGHLAVTAYHSGQPYRLEPGSTLHLDEQAVAEKLYADLHHHGVDLIPDPSPDKAKAKK